MSHRDRSPSGSNASEGEAIHQKRDQGAARQQQDRVAQAEQLYAEALAAGQGEARKLKSSAHHLLGVIKFQAGQLERALEFIDQAITLTPDSAEAHCSRGDVLKELKRFTEAIASYDRAIQLKPDLVEAYANRSLVQQDIKQHDKPLTSYDNTGSIAVNPRHARPSRKDAIDDMIERNLIAIYAHHFGRPPQTNPPVTFNEHVLHRIIYDRDPRLKTFSDKLAVRDYICDKVGCNYVVPLLGVWRRASEIRFDDLPAKFFLKANHGCNFMLFIDGHDENMKKKITAIAERWLGMDYFNYLFEWGYKDLPRHLLAEPILMSADEGSILEVSVYTFEGVAKLFQLHRGTKFLSERRECYTDTVGRHLAIRRGQKPSIKIPADMKYFSLSNELRNEIIYVSERVSAGVSFLRVDFYVTDAGLKIGELTPYPGAGLAKWSPPSLDLELGRLWDTDYDLSAFPELQA